MRLFDHSTRYGYYLACTGALVVLHLLTAWPPSLLSLSSPVGIGIALAVVGAAVGARHEESEPLVTDIVQRQREYFLHEFFVYVVVALLSLIITRELLQQPLGHAMHDTLFILVFGYFAAVENTLTAVRNWYRQGVQQRIETFCMIPLLVTLERATYGLVGAILLFLLGAIFRFNGALEDARLGQDALVALFGIELLVFLLLLAALLLRIARNYTTNIHYILETQLKVVRDAQAGDYSQSIPMLTQNELGLMGLQLNRLMEYVRKRQDIENLLKRVVSPEIMEKLLNTDTDLLKRGEEREVAILFCDIRGFTEMSEGASAADIILFLNSFFADLSEIVTRNHGTINKFMGDAILAVFGGTETAREAVESATTTANEITLRVRQMRLPNGGSPETGTGIHFGKVVAGTIGSEQRYEYTYLGDAVNTASRLQGLSKRLGYPVIVSSEAYEMLPGHLQDGLVDLGRHVVRGKVDALHIYGGPDESRN